MPPARAPRAICLIGMSNIGKSHWAARLADEAGFEVVDCDSLLTRRLFPEATDCADLRALADWLGQPGEPRYEDNSRRLLAAEREVMLAVIARLRADAGTRPLVIDTGGSVIHAGDDVLAALRGLSRVVYLEATPAQRERLYARYLAEPKPLIWGDAWRPAPGEAVDAARRRCYPALLAARAARYAGLAEITLPADLMSRPEGLASLLSRVDGGP